MNFLDQVDMWLSAREDEHVEFKEAKANIDSKTLVRYCCALANEGGGFLVLGVSPKLPRRVVGSSACRNLPGTIANLLDRLHIRVHGDEVDHTDGRVVVFEIPSRPVGTPLEVNGTYWMRAGESLTGMSPDELRRIFAESVPDFTAQVCPGADLADLDRAALADFRGRWSRKTRNPSLENLSDRQTLADVELTVDEALTYAALILLGTPAAVSRHLPQAEVVFEYRSTMATGPAQQRIDLQGGFFTWYQRLWEAVNARNDLQHYQEGLFVWDIPTFDEDVVRELVLNAVSHRDYRLHGSVFVRQHPRRLEIVSPGGLPEGITVENILWRQSPRNRRICEAFQRCGLVERSGQGMNRVVETCVLQSKALPDFTGTDDYQVSVSLAGVVDDPRFAAMVSKIANEELARLGTAHFMALDSVHRTKKVSPELKPAAADLIDLGIIERVKRGRFVLSRRMYAAIGRKGAYTRHRGLDRETNKQLILRHIRENADAGSRMDELMQVLPSMTRGQISWILRQLRDAGEIQCRGRTKAARWFPIAALNRPSTGNPTQTATQSDGASDSKEEA